MRNVVFIQQLNGLRIQQSDYVLRQEFSLLQNPYWLEWIVINYFFVRADASVWQDTCALEQNCHVLLVDLVVDVRDLIERVLNQIFKFLRDILVYERLDLQKSARVSLYIWLWKFYLHIFKLIKWTVLVRGMKDRFSPSLHRGQLWVMLALALIKRRHPIDYWVSPLWRGYHF